jgi:phosphatidylserine/phosphatidylglycerophosphate/cardiolipin synthase-like enzyme
MRKLIAALILLTACSQDIPYEQGEPIEVYFCEREDCSSRLVGLLTDAEAVCALYHVTRPEVLAALESAAWVTDKEGDRGLMHNKYCVVNESVVWTGSWNPGRGTKADNAVIIHSAVLAQNYREEWEELPGGYRRVRYPKLVYNNKLIENYFCPDDDCKERVMEQLRGARQSIVFMLAYITDEDIVAQLNRKDIRVDGIIDKSQKDAHKAVPVAAEGSVHHKVFIIDGKTVITGSYNPTTSGDQRNDENILIIHDPLIAKKYLDEYRSLILPAAS